MNKEQLSDAIGNISDEHIETNAKDIQPRKNHILRTVLAIAAVLVLAVTAVLIIPKLLPDHSTPDTSLTSDAPSDPSQTASSQETEPTEEPSADSPETVPLSYAVAEAVYPEEISELYLWNSTKEDTYQYKIEDGKTDSLQYTRAILKTFFSGTKENAVFSPLSLYFSLASLAEMSNGETRAQIFDLLGATDMES